MNDRLEILKAFQEWNPELVNKMKNCSHHFDSKNQSPFHICDDVWTHTMLMYQDFMRIEHEFGKLIYTDYNEEYVHSILPIIILCHDAGKIYTRQVPNNQFGKIAMYGHSFASVQIAIDFIDYLRKNKDIFYPSIPNTVYNILNVISNHMDYFNASIEDRILMANNNKVLFIAGEILNYLDHRNSMDEKGDFLDVIYVPSEIPDFENEKYDGEIDITIYCGVPGCGKDFIAEKNDDVIVSFDDLRVHIYKENNPEKASEHFDIKKLYEEAFRYCNENKIDLNAVLKQEVESLVSNGHSVGIANTNLTRKARRSLVNMFHKYNIKIVYIVNNSDTLFYRNENRTSKTLDRLVMNKFIYNQQVPSLFEFKNNHNVKKIELIYN